jgi:hypothetical protein
MPSKTNMAAAAGTALTSIPKELIDHFVIGPMGDKVDRNPIN